MLSMNFAQDSFSHSTAAKRQGFIPHCLRLLWRLLSKRRPFLQKKVGCFLTTSSLHRLLGSSAPLVTASLLSLVQLHCIPTFGQKNLLLFLKTFYRFSKRPPAKSWIGMRFLPDDGASTTLLRNSGRYCPSNTQPSLHPLVLQALRFCFGHHEVVT